MLKDGWPIYELWKNNKFVDFFEFIPNNLVGVYVNNNFIYWEIFTNQLFILDTSRKISLIFKKHGNNLYSVYSYDKNIYILKYIET